MTTARRAKAPTLRTLGVSHVAGWLGIEAGYLSKLMQRYPHYPEPAATIEPGRRDRPDEGWLESSRPEWEGWRASQPGRGAPGQPRSTRHARARRDASEDQAPGAGRD